MNSTRFYPDCLAFGRGKGLWQGYTWTVTLNLNSQAICTSLDVLATREYLSDDPLFALKSSAVTPFDDILTVARGLIVDSALAASRQLSLWEE